MFLEGVAKRAADALMSTDPAPKDTKNEDAAEVDGGGGTDDNLPIDIAVVGVLAVVAAAALVAKPCGGARRLRGGVAQLEPRDGARSLRGGGTERLPPNYVGNDVLVFNRAN